MSNEEINEKLKEINIENYIWIIYVGIIFMSWYSNSLEKKYYVNKDINCKRKYRHVMIVIFTILLIVYIYFLINSYNSLKKMKTNTSEKNKNMLFLSFIASLLITISGAIFLYVTIIDNDLEVELAFN